METLSHAATQMAILFACVIIGMIARKAKLMNERFDAMLSRLVLSVALPGMILASVLGNDDLPDSGTVCLILLCSAISYVVIVAVALILSRFVPVSPKTRGTYAYVAAFGNTGFIGFPVLNAILGSQAVVYGAIYNIVFNLVIYSVGIVFLLAGEREGDFKDRARSIGRSLVGPCNIACIAVFFLALFQVTDHGPVEQVCSLIGQMTVPAAMLLIGSTLATMSIKSVFASGWSWAFSAVRLIVVPLLIFFLFRMFIDDATLLGALTLIAAMPVASSGVMMSLTYGGDIKAMTQCTFITTVFSIVTIPLITLLVI